MTDRAKDGKSDIDPGRRRMLMRLGLAASVSYIAPVLLHLGAAGASSFSAPSGARPRRARASALRPEIVVSASDSATIDLIASQGYGLLSRDRLSLIDAEIARFSLPPSLTVEQARQQILDLAPDALSDLNHIYRPDELACGDDGCMAFDMIGWNSAADACPADTVIGMIDTTVNTQHAALQGADIEAFSAIAEGRKPGSAIHGTAVAILMVGKQDTRTPGLLSKARVIAAEAFHSDAAGQDAADVFDVARALSLLSERNVGVVNLSFTGPDNLVLKRVVEAARARDIILVAAAGNAGPSSDPLYPAAYDGVVAVTAVDRQSRLYRRANRGEHIDFAAPGVRVWTAASVSGGRFRSGTSYAAPFVTAALAVSRSRWPDDDSDALLGRLADQAVDLGDAGRDSAFGWGLVQAPVFCGGEGAVLPTATP